MVRGNVRTVAVALIAMAVGIGAPLAVTGAANAVDGTSVTFTADLESASGAGLTDFVVYPLVVSESETAGASDAATAVTGNPGLYSMSLTSGLEYTLLLEPTGASATDGTVQYLGGTSTMVGATTFIPSSTNQFLTAFVDKGASVQGRVTSPDGTSLKGAEVDLYRDDQSEWSAAGYVTTTSSGSYSFKSVPAGSYKAEFIAPHGKYATIYSGGATDLAGAAASFVPASGQLTVNQKFSGGTGSIKGELFELSKLGNPSSAAGYTPVAIPVSGQSDGQATELDRSAEVQGAVLPFPGTGKWSIGNLPAGDYVVLMKPSYSYQSESYLDAPGGKTVGDGVLALSDALIYRVSAGKTINTGDENALTAYGDYSGAGLSMTVYDSDSDPVSGALVNVISNAGGLDGHDTDSTWPLAADGSSSDSADDSLVVGSADSTGTVHFTFLDGAPLSTDGKGILTGAGYDLTPGSYAVEVVDPSGQHEPVTEDVDLRLGSNSVPVSLPLVTTPPGFSTAPSVSGSSFAVGTTYSVPNDSAESARDSATVSFQWLRDGHPIYGATGRSYTASAGDLGMQLSVRATISEFGFADVTAFAYVGGGESSSWDSALGNLETMGDTITEATDPTIIAPSGDTTVNSILYVAPGTWTVDGSPVAGLSFHYVWKGGATGTTYTPTDAQVQAHTPIGVSVTATKPGFVDSQPVTSSNTVTPMGLAGLAATKAPTVVERKSGAVETYTVSSGSWDQSNLTYTYDWELNGTPEGTTATVNSSTLPAMPYAYPLTVQVTAHKSGFAPAPSVLVTAVEGTDAPTQVGSLVVTDNTTHTVVMGEASTATVGDKLVVTAPLAWSLHGESITPTKVTYYWGHGSRFLAEPPTGSTYVVKTSDVTYDISLYEVATFANALPATGSSETVSFGVLPTLAEPSVAVSGYSTAGNKLTAKITGPKVVGVSYTYQWYHCPASSSCLSDENANAFLSIPGATAPTYTPTLDDQAVFVVAIANAKNYNGSFAQSGIVFVAAADELLGEGWATVSGTISGHVSVGTKLTVAAAPWSAAGVSNSFIWQTSTDENSWDDVSIGPSYTPNATDFGAGDTDLRVEDVGTVGALSQTVTSEFDYDVVPGTLALVNAPKASASATQFSVTTGTYSVPVVAGDTTYQWYDNGVAGGTAASIDHNGSADAGRLIAVDVTETLPGYSNAITTTVVVQAGTMTASAESIDGIPAVGSQLQVADATPFGGAGDKPVTTTFQWFANGRAIAGATSTTYTPKALYFGDTISFTATGKSAFYASQSISASSSKVALGSFGSPDEPVLNYSGTLQPGTVVSIGEPVLAIVPTYSYQWERSVGSGDWTPITGATKSTYTPVAGDVTDELEVLVTYSSAKFSPVTLPSTAVTVEYAPALVALTGPSLTASPTVGSTITLSSGTWNTPGLTFSYVWYRNGVAIPGVTGTSWVATADSYGDEVTGEVTASRAGYAPVSATTEAESVALGDTPTSLTAPAVATLVNVSTVSSGVWDVSGLTFTYEWVLVDGSTVTPATGDGATTNTYTRTPTDSGVLEALVTVAKPGYPAEQLTVVGPTLASQ